MNRILIAILAFIVICYSGIALTAPEISAPLSLSHARVAISKLGLREFVIDDNRYLLRRADILRIERVLKDGSVVFGGEIEIKPLSKHGQ